MQIVSDRGMDLSPEQLEGLDIHFVPLLVTLEGKTYRSGEDISAEQFYKMLDSTDSYPTTSQPSAGDFAAMYRGLAQKDPEILSIHISSGLSGTLASARAGAAMVPEAKVTFVDTKTLACPMGWQVEAAARGLKAGWSLEKILEVVCQVGEATEGMFTLDNLKYLIHGGRISHLKGLLASILRIHPVIGVEKEHGTYVNLAQERTLKKAISKMAECAARLAPNYGKLRVQLLHGNNLEAVEVLRARLQELADCIFLPTAVIGPALGAHTGGGLVGMACAAASKFPELP